MSQSLIRVFVVSSDVILLIICVLNFCGILITDENENIKSRLACCAEVRSCLKAQKISELLWVLDIKDPIDNKRGHDSSEHIRAHCYLCAVCKQRE